MGAGQHPILAYPEKCTGCLRCQLRCSWTYVSAFNPSESYIQVELGDVNRISFTELCNACGFCVDECPFGALELE